MAVHGRLLLPNRGRPVLRLRVDRPTEHDHQFVGPDHSRNSRRRHPDADLNLDYRETSYYIDPTLAYWMSCIIPQMRHVLDRSLLHKLHQTVRGASR